MDRDWYHDGGAGRRGEGADDRYIGELAWGIDAAMADSAQSTALNLPLAKAALDAKKAAEVMQPGKPVPDPGPDCGPSPDPGLRAPDWFRLKPRKSTYVYHRPADDPRAGILWMIGACAFFATFGAMARYLSLIGVHPLQVMFLRLLVAIVFLAPLYFWRGPSFFQSTNLTLYGMRSLIGFVSMVSWFYAIRAMPIAELTAIQFLAPIFGTIGAVFILGEKVRLRRWTAMFVAFIGALVILRPGHVPLNEGTALALISTMSAGITSILVKQLTHHDDPDKVVFLTNAFMTPFALLPALWVWQWPSLSVWLLIVALGAIGTIGHLMLVRAFACADASLVMTLDFSKLPFAVALGYLVFGELTTVWTWIGALIIFSSGLYIVHREAEVKRQKVLAAKAAVVTPARS